jgi:hypothetical protein
MSDWTFIKGSCISKRVSIKKIINDIFDGSDFRFEYDHFKFCGSFDQIGESAFQSIQEIVKRAKEFDTNCKIYIEVETIIY